MHRSRCRPCHVRKVRNHWISSALFEVGWEVIIQLLETILSRRLRSHNKQGKKSEPSLFPVWTTRELVHEKVLSRTLSRRTEVSEVLMFFFACTDFFNLLTSTGCVSSSASFTAIHSWLKASVASTRLFGLMVRHRETKSFAPLEIFRQNCGRKSYCPFRVRSKTLSSSSSSKGRYPPRSKKRMTPTDQTSHLTSYAGHRSRISGAKYPGVPHKVRHPFFFPTDLANPKSANLTGRRSLGSYRPTRKRYCEWECHEGRRIQI